MKQLLALALLSVALAACTGSSVSSGGNCARGVCVKVSIDEPVPFNQPVNVRITVETEQDMSRVGIYLTSNYPAVAVAEGTSDWVVDTKAHQPVTVTGAIRFTQEDYYVAVIGAVTAPVAHVQDIVTVHTARAGGTVYLPNTPLPITREVDKTPPPVILNSQGTPIPSPTKAGSPWVPDTLVPRPATVNATVVRIPSPTPTRTPGPKTPVVPAYP